jgi:hypothetical protein
MIQLFDIKTLGAFAVRGYKTARLPNADFGALSC